MSLFYRVTWNSCRRNFVGRLAPGVRPEQTNTDLSRQRLGESGFRVKRVALAATGCSPRLKASKSRHDFSCFFFSLGDVSYFTSILRSLTFTRVTRLSTPKTSESPRVWVNLAALFIQSMVNLYKNLHGSPLNLDIEL